VLVAALLIVVWPVDNRPDHDQQRCYHHVPIVKEGAANEFYALDDGRESA